MGMKQIDNDNTTRGNVYTKYTRHKYTLTTTYLYKYGHDAGEACPECHNERETAEHVFLTCSKCVDQRNFLERTLGFQVTPNNIVNLRQLERNMCFLKVLTQ